MSTHTARRAFYILPGIIVMLAILASGWQRFAAMRNDFLQFYVSAHLLGTPDLYNIDANRSLAQTLAPHADIATFPSRPAFHTMLIWPFGLLPLNASLVCFELFSIACLILFTRLYSTRCPTLPVYASLSVPAAVCLMNGQDSMLVLLIVGLSVVLAERERNILAGMVLSLCAVKFHLFLFLPVILLLQKRWKVLSGLAAGASVLMLATFAIQGFRWPLDLLAVLRTPSLTPFTASMPNLHGLWFGLGVDSFPLEAASFLLVALLVAKASWNADISQGIAIAVVGGLLTSYHAYLYDPILLLVPLAILPVRSVWAALTLPPLYWLVVMEGTAGTVGVAGLVTLMMTGLALIAFPNTYRAIQDSHHFSTLKARSVFQRLGSPSRSSSK